MKYIRTKDGIENIENLFLVDYYDINGNAYKLEKNSMAATKIDYEKLFPNNKVADTIEELCDCYLCFTKSGKNWITTENYETAKLYAERGCKVNACILTDKGLIYVAKMNDKGELELL